MSAFLAATLLSRSTILPQFIGCPLSNLTSLIPAVPRIPSGSAPIPLPFIAALSISRAMTVAKSLEIKPNLALLDTIEYLQFPSQVRNQ